MAKKDVTTRLTNRLPYMSTDAHDVEWAKTLPSLASEVDLAKASQLLAQARERISVLDKNEPNTLARRTVLAGLEGFVSALEERFAALDIPRQGQQVAAAAFS